MKVVIVNFFEGENRPKYLADSKVFTSMEKAKNYAKKAFEDYSYHADMGCGIFKSTTMDDMIYTLIDMDNNEYEWIISDEIEVQ